MNLPQNHKIEIPKELAEQMEKDKPSSDPAHWAKSSCTTCHGRGKLGKIKMVLPGNNVIEQEETLCHCARKNYQKWQEEWLAAHRPAPEKKSNGNGHKTVPVAHVMGRLDRLDDQLSEMKTEAHQLVMFLDALPHKEQLVKIEAGIKQQEETRASVLEQVQRMEAEAVELRQRAALLSKQAAELENGAANLTHKVVPEINKDLGTLQVEQEKVRREYHAHAHKWSRQYRILEDKIGKLSKRRERVARDGGISQQTQET